MRDYGDTCNPGVIIYFSIPYSKLTQSTCTVDLTIAYCGSIIDAVFIKLYLIALEVFDSCQQII